MGDSTQLHLQHKTLTCSVAPVPSLHISVLTPPPLLLIYVHTCVYRILLETETNRVQMHRLKSGSSDF